MEWIKCSDRSPDLGDYSRSVDVLCFDESMWVGFYELSETGLRWNNYDEWNGWPTHWMPLPYAPKEKDHVCIPRIICDCWVSNCKHEKTGGIMVIECDKCKGKTMLSKVDIISEIKKMILHGPLSVDPDILAHPDFEQIHDEFILTDEYIDVRIQLMEMICKGFTNREYKQAYLESLNKFATESNVKFNGL